MNTKHTLIDTPYGKKTPELLCRAMDALDVRDELVSALQFVLDNPARPDLFEHVAAVALSKTKGE